ncbi:juvenile hormone epoxide hydrolase-like isoform X2 [Anticarsia gemmatalis]|uniref:juvenile hormone epoxide hydrolase-like isoform X2 n=1 Tax=Anticarsia gemmatalis TaxID=129554 RepID=UPI003F769DC2
MSTNTKLPERKTKIGSWIEQKLGQDSKAFCIILILGLIIAWCLYKLNEIPPKPEIDLQEWWGPYPMDMQTDESIRPFSVEFSDMTVNDLRERLLHRRPFAPPIDKSGFKYGLNSDFMTTVLDFWQNKYNFEERERYINKYNHYITNIQGLDIHYVHVKPKADSDVEVIPLLLIHSWPTSFRYFYEMIPTLIAMKPEQNFVFEIIVPSLPGFGYSKATTRDIMGPIAISVVLRNLMHRIGHERYYVHGEDLGQSIGSVMATLFPEEVLGLHITPPIAIYNQWTPLYVFWDEFKALFTFRWDDRMSLVTRLTLYFEEFGYYLLQSTKSDTVGIALTDSPAGLAAYILEKFSTWTNYNYNRKAEDGGLLNKYHLTHLLDNIMIYWTTNSITTSMRPHFVYTVEMVGLDRIPTKVPTWGLKFKNVLVYTPEQALQSKFINYLRTNHVADGGHFPAMELPQLLANDIHDAVAAFREFRKHNDDLPEPPKSNKPTVYDFTVNDINGNEVSLKKYRGKVLIIVNVASQCGYTDTHYTQLNELYEKYQDKGLRILAFPCNQFGGQEPGTLKEILQFTQKKNVQFDIFEKVDVNGENTHPLWEFLKKSQAGTIGNFIKWNFSKFIIDRNGIPVERFGPNVDPIDLEPYLEKYF